MATKDRVASSSTHVPSTDPPAVVTSQRILPETPKVDPGDVVWLSGEAEKPVIYGVSEPEFVGRIPVRTEIEVLPADVPYEMKIGWTVRCYDGTEVYKMGERVAILDRPLTNFDDIKPGDKLIVQTLVGMREMIARMDNEDEGLYAECEGLLADLVFDHDDRHCWVSTYAINKNCLDKLHR